MVSYESMEPYLISGDLVFIVNPRIKKIKQNSIIVVDNDKKGEIIKRVVGMPGDIVFNRNDSLLLLNHPLSEKNQNVTYQEFTYIPKGCYYILGDNTKVSYDSRSFGLINRNKIVGIVLFIVRLHD